MPYKYVMMKEFGGRMLTMNTNEGWTKPGCAKMDHSAEISLTLSLILIPKILPRGGDLIC